MTFSLINFRNEDLLWYRAARIVFVALALRQGNRPMFDFAVRQLAEQVMDAVEPGFLLVVCLYHPPRRLRDMGALESHLRSHYAYSFATVFTSQHVTPLDAFLFDTRRGHCEFFASAMAVMLREIGIPSRVVHGYLSQGYNPVTGLYKVRRFDGHAWVEAYFDQLGWVSFEPTAAYPVPHTQMQGETALDGLKRYTEQLAQQDLLQGKTELVATLAGVFRALAETWHLLSFMLEQWLAALKEGFMRHAVTLAAIGIVAVLGAMAVYRGRAQLLWLWARIVLRVTPHSKIAVIAFHQLERVARARNAGRATHETADEYVTRMQAAHPDIHMELHVLRRAFNAARYAGRRLTGEEAKRVMQAAARIGSVLCSRPQKLPAN